MALFGSILSRGGAGKGGDGAQAAVEIGTVRVALVLSPDTAAAIDLPALERPDADIRLVEGGLAAFAGNGPQLRRTDMAVVEVDPADPSAMTNLQNFISTTGARIPVVAAVRGLTISTTRPLLRLGIVDVLPVPFNADELALAIDASRVRLVELRSGQGPSRTGRIVAFMGALGGVGNSMIATQAAQMWAENKDVLLIDLDVQRGNAALYMNLKPRLSLSDLIESGDRVDGEFLRLVAERHQSGVSVIAAPSDMTPLDALTPEIIERLLDVASHQYEMVVLDLPGLWMDWTAEVVNKADMVGLVTELTVAGLQQARRQLDVLDANNMTEKVRVIINRMTTGLFGRYDTGEAQQILRLPVPFVLANDYPTVSAALDEGRSIRQIKMKARVEKDLRQLVTTMSEDIAAMGLNL